MHSSLSLTTFLFVALGGAGIYLMLPRGTSGGRFARWSGGALATFALALLTSQFAERLETVSEIATFYLLAGISIGSAAMTITSRNPIFSALWFALLLLSNSGLYLYQGAEFLAASTVIIYAGAIIVTFLFVIMLAQPQGTASYDRHSREPMLSCVAGVVLAGTLMGTLSDVTRQEMRSETAETSLSSVPHREEVAEVLAKGSTTAFLPPIALDSASEDAASEESEGELVASGETVVRIEHVDSLGRTLFLDHFVSIEVVAMLLLVAVIGAVLIATTATSGATPGGAKAEKQA